MFLQTNTNDLNLVRELLDVFGMVSGLATNIAMSSVTPTKCKEDRELVASLFVCEIKDFPCTYLCLPLAILVDKGADNLPKWKRWEASLINHAGQLITVRVVLTFAPAYLIIGMDLPKCLIKAIDKWCRCILWVVQETASGSNCLVSLDLWVVQSRMMSCQGVKE